MLYLETKYSIIMNRILDCIFVKSFSIQFLCCTWQITHLRIWILRKSRSSCKSIPKRSSEKAF